MENSATKLGGGDLQQQEDKRRPTNSGRFLHSTPTSDYGKMPMHWGLNQMAADYASQSLWNFGQLNIQDTYSPQPMLKSEYGRRPPFSGRRSGLPPKFRLQDHDHDDSMLSSHSFSSANNSRWTTSSSRASTLPTWAIDETGNIRSSVTVRAILAKNDIVAFATDKIGCHFLQKHYPGETENGIRDQVFHKIVEDRDTFLAMCQNIFGNFFIQRVIECSRPGEQEVIMLHLLNEMATLCVDKCACRVIQIAIQKLDTNLAAVLALELRTANLKELCSDQNGNHVIQKIVKTLPVSAWDFIVEFLGKDENLIYVCQDKYGCRVVQSIIEKLSDNPKATCYAQRTRLLHTLMAGIVKNCSQLASNEFANYVVQHIIKAGGVMESYRNTIIEKCLLRNLLSMSQEKYASHVVEGALLFAPPNLLREMMEEIFDGYVPHPETNRDALDILLFHQFGNYIIQQMIHICCSAILGHEERKMDETELQVHRDWLERIKKRVARNISRLERFSSGKKIMDALAKMDNNYWSTLYSQTGADSFMSLPQPSTPEALTYYGTEGGRTSFYNFEQ